MTRITETVSSATFAAVIALGQPAVTKGHTVLMVNAPLLRDHTEFQELMVLRTGLTCSDLEEATHISLVLDDSLDVAPLFSVAVAMPLAIPHTQYSDYELRKTLQLIADVEGLDDDEIPLVVFITSDGEIWAVNSHSLLDSFPDEEDVWSFHSHVDQPASFDDIVSELRPNHGEVIHTVYRKEGV